MSLVVDEMEDMEFQECLRAGKGCLDGQVVIVGVESELASELDNELDTISMLDFNLPLYISSRSLSSP